MVHFILLRMAIHPVSVISRFPMGCHPGEALRTMPSPSSVYVPKSSSPLLIQGSPLCDV